MKKLLMILPLVFLLCFAFSCQQGKEVAGEKEAEPTIIVDNAISADGVSIAYGMRGEGEPALFFVHGWCCDRSYWNEQLPYFSQKYQVVTIDLVGHGESGIKRESWSMETFGEDVVAVADKLGLDRIVLIGHSMGGAAILEAARLMSGRVIGLVGVDTFDRIRGPRSQERIDEFLGSFKNNFSEATDNWVRSWFTPNSDPTLVEKIATDMAAARPEVGLGEFIALMKYDYVPAVQHIELPIRCINNSRNEKLVEKAQQYAYSYVVVAISDVSHFVMMEDPETFNCLLEEIIQEFVQMAEEK